MLGLRPAKRTTWRWYEIEGSGRTDIRKFKRLCRRACRLEIWAALIPYEDQLDNIGNRCEGSVVAIEISCVWARWYVL